MSKLLGLPYHVIAISRHCHPHQQAQQSTAPAVRFPIAQTSSKYNNSRQDTIPERQKQQSAQQFFHLAQGAHAHPQRHWHTSCYP